MRDLGYDRYVAQGGDVGALISLALAGQHPERVAGVHVNFLVTPPPDDPAQLVGLSESEQARLGRMSRFVADLSGYMKLQSTPPQTLAYGLTDSPVGQLAWIVEKFGEWTEFERGGHFAAMEQPDLFVGDLQAFARTLGQGGSYG